ncbi:unnamed protein product [Prorocentrum cordatum]|uniref:Protein of centriole 5 n=1 Tax=Prorocentrum cordatum TaxID=2364126 RepID=A0ABN9TCT9_9DINO|nr:unnamed protein product [Polarella glacialis]
MPGSTRARSARAAASSSPSRRPRSPAAAPSTGASRRPQRARAQEEPRGRRRSPRRQRRRASRRPRLSRRGGVPHGSLAQRLGGCCLRLSPLGGRGRCTSSGWPQRGGGRRRRKVGCGAERSRRSRPTSSGYDALCSAPGGWRRRAAAPLPRRGARTEALRRAVLAEEREAARARQVAHHAARRHLTAAMVGWKAALQLQRREATHRQRTLHAEVEFATKLHKVKTEGAKLADDLRGQRRAHGVAAIHASMDRCMQAVVHAWSATTREQQREAAYQRQLDIAAAEAAAGCAVLRMEGRRNALDLRRKWRAEAQRVEAARAQNWRLAVLTAWASLGRAARRELLVAQLAASRATVGRQAWQVGRWQEAFCNSKQRARRARCIGEAFLAWSLAVSLGGIGAAAGDAAVETAPAAAVADKAAPAAAAATAAVAGGIVSEADSVSQV